MAPSKILMTPQMDKSLKVRQNAIPRTATAGKLLAVKNDTRGSISLVTQHYCLLLLGKVAFSTAQHGGKQANKYAVKKGLLNVKSNLLKASHEVYLS